jgi:hypothetical protein
MKGMADKNKDLSAIIANAKQKVLNAQDEMFGAMIKLHKEHKHDPRGVCVIQQLMYTAEEVERKEQEDERVEQYVVKLITRAAVWKTSNAGKVSALVQRLGLSLLAERLRANDNYAIFFVCVTVGTLHIHI